VAVLVVALAAASSNAQGGGRRRPGRRPWYAAESSEQTLQLQRMVESIHNRAAATGTLSWADFHALGIAEDGAEPYRVELTNADFKTGTLRIQRPAYLVLSENIDFEPNAESDWNPVCYGPNPQMEYCDPEDDASFAYKLGFFAAMALECTDCVVDLNGYTMQQTATHALQQRFYANIELADQPFITNQGPADFGSSIHACKNCAVVNGVLGLSSHHGIHGNDAENILVDNVSFRDYEVAAIHFNGLRRATVIDTEVEGSRTDIPTIATYSQARFLKKFVEGLLMQMPDSADKDSLNAAYTSLVDALNNVFEDVITLNDGVTGGAINSITHPEEYELFHNAPVTLPWGEQARIVDGNAYGVHAHIKGVGVNDLFDGSDITDDSLQDIEIIRTEISRTLANVQEVVTVSRLDDPTKPQGGVAGETMRIDLMTNADGTYKSNPMSDLHLLLAHLKVTNDYVAIAAGRGALGGFSVDPSLYDWSISGTSIDDYVSSTDSSYLCNRDAMFHVQKGVFGLIVQGSRGLVMQNSSVSDTVNMGPSGDAERCGQYYKYSDTTQMKGYTGSPSAGICVTGSLDVRSSRMSVQGVYSENQDAFGVEFMNMDYADVPLEPDFDIDNIATGAASGKGGQYPNGVPMSMSYVVQ